MLFAWLRLVRFAETYRHPGSRIRRGDDGLKQAVVSGVTFDASRHRFSSLSRVSDDAERPRHLDSAPRGGGWATSWAKQSATPGPSVCKETMHDLPGVSWSWLERAWLSQGYRCMLRSSTPSLRRPWPGWPTSAPPRHANLYCAITSQRSDRAGRIGNAAASAPSALSNDILSPSCPFELAVVLATCTAIFIVTWAMSSPACLVNGQPDLASKHACWLVQFHHYRCRLRGSAHARKSHESPGNRTTAPWAAYG